MRFLHTADAHLGYQQYNSSERFEDFGLAFEHAVLYGVEQQVDAILVAGDFFNKATVEPWAFIQATDVLKPAKQAGIPVIAIEGNHDQARYRDQISWLRVLANEGYLILLTPTFADEAIQLGAWDGNQGSYIDVKNVRIVGVPWLGAATAAWISDIASAIKALPRNGTNCTVLLTHAGIEGQMPNVPGCLTYAQIESLRPCVDYLALGHLHKPFEQDGWAHNPGSLEVCSVDECQWKKGLYDVTVDAHGGLKSCYEKSPHRPFYHESFEVDGYSNPTKLYRALRDVLRQRAAKWSRGERKPVVEIRLTGTLEFDRADLDLDMIKQIIDGEVAPLISRVSSGGLKLRGMECVTDETLPQADLERTVLREIALTDSRYATQPEAWANVMLEIKDLALESKSPQAILEALQARMNELTEEAGRC